MDLHHTSVTLPSVSFDSVASAWRVALAQNFAHASVSVVECPDLRVWGMASEGLCGNVEVCDVGSPLNVEIGSRRRHYYAMNDVARILGRPKAFYWGAGAASDRVVGKNAELMPNTHLGTALINTHYTAIVDDDEGKKFRSGRYESNDFANLANFGVADGVRGPVLEVECRGRVGAQNFVECLASALKDVAEQVSVAGVFRVLEGRVRAHVMPEFPADGCDFDTKEKIDNWLKFFEMPAPLTCLSVFHSADVHKLGLRMQHTHFFSDDDRGGHYHNDVAGHEVHYKGYFVLATKLTKID